VTKRGRAAYAKIHDILSDIEREWSTELGAKPFTMRQLKVVRRWNNKDSVPEPHISWGGR
jgi:hypothetical protein